MSTSSQTPQMPAFRIKAIKVKSPDPMSVLALLPPEIKKQKIVIKPAPVVATSVIVPEEPEVVAVEPKPEVVAAQPELIAQPAPVEQMEAVVETPSYLPDPNSMLAILPAEDDEIEVERFGATNKIAGPKTFAQENIAGVSEFEVVPMQETSLAEIETSEIEMAEEDAPEAAMEMETTEAEVPSLPAVGKPNVFDVASKIGKWIKGHVKIQANRKRLRVSESVSLGEKRFIAVVQLDGNEFLVGGAPNSLSLLANVGKNGNATFAEVLNESYEQGRNQG